MSEECCDRSEPVAFQWATLFILTCLSGCFSGLNLGLMSLTVEDLNIVIRSSDDPTQVKHAKQILPLRKRGNMLLCTLLIGNTVVNVCLSVVTDPIWKYAFGCDASGAFLALALPSVLIVIFGEIVPQSVCSRYALLVGAKTLPLTYFFVFLTLPFSIPISFVLDKLLGDEISGVFTRKGLLQLIKLNVEDAAHQKESGLTTEDAKILGGALTFKDTKVAEVMTPLEKVFSLPIDTVLNENTFLQILEKGHTRVPVYEGDETNIVALLLVKNLLGIGYEHNLTLKSVLEKFNEKNGVSVSRVIRISKHTKLNHALDVCKKNHVHMLVVTEEAAGPVANTSGRASSQRISSASERASSAVAGIGPAIGVATVEDFLEEILQEEIVDETDVYVDNEYSTRSPPGSVRVSKTRSSWISNEDSTRSSVGESPSMGRARLNSKHFDTTVVLRSISVRASTTELPRSSMMQRASTSPGGVDLGGVDLSRSERASQQSTTEQQQQQP